VCGLAPGMRELERILPDLALAKLAGRQWGVVSLAQLRALGIRRSGVTRRVQGGRLRRVHRGVYAVGGAVLPREGRWLAAVMACGPRAVLSHVSAAVHWNLLNYEPPRPEVTAPASRKGVPGIRLHRSHSIDAQDTTNHQGILTTTMHRTLLDIAAQVPIHHLERALAQAERLQLYDQKAIEAVIQRANGHPYATTACRGPSSTSPSMPPTTQVSRSTATSRRIAWSWRPTAGTPTAPDGRSKMTAPRTPPSPAAGYRVVRFTWRQLRYDPQTVADRLSAILRYTAPSASRNSASSDSSME
jgi:hypothetical protein